MLTEDCVAKTLFMLRIDSLSGRHHDVDVDRQRAQA